MFIYLDKQHQLQGIKLCNVRSKQLLSDANKLVISGGSLNSALALYIFAVEEYGKARLLQEFIYTPLCLIDKRKFTSHEYKIQKGLDHLDSCCKKIELTIKMDLASDRTMMVRNVKTKYTLDEIISVPSNVTGNFQTDGFEPVREVVRWSCIYTDFDAINQEWFIETMPNRDDLLIAISSFKAKL